MATPLKIALRPAAIDDIRTAGEWYESERAGLGEEFGLALDRLFHRLSVFPRSAPVVEGYDPVRRLKLRGFPYAVFYRPGEKQVDILRVVHTSRSPDAWRVGGTDA